MVSSMSLKGRARLQRFKDISRIGLALAIKANDKQWTVNITLIKQLLVRQQRSYTETTKGQRSIGFGLLNAIMELGKARNDVLDGGSTIVLARPNEGERS